MEKYLFTDGTNVIREVESREELQSLIQSSAEPARARIWIFNTNEWISIAEFNKRTSRQHTPVKIAEPVAEIKAQPKPRRKTTIPGYVKKGAIGVISATVIFLVYNFTRVTWRKGSSLNITAERPANTPPVNADSLIETIEILRGQKLDKITRTNLRIRNTWPDLIQLQLTADRDISRNGSRFYNAEVAIDNSTGYNLDNAVVKLDVWKENEVTGSDTIRFNFISYSALAKRKLDAVYRGDSIAVSFISIKSKVFNFCYSSEKKSNYGNYNDRWFCRE